MYEKIKKYYDSGVCTEKRVRDALEKGVTTVEDYKAITGKDYEAA